MKIRDSHAKINGDQTEHEMPSGGLDVIADDGRALFSISLAVDGAIHVATCGVCKHNGEIMDDGIMVRPRSGNSVAIVRRKYEEWPPLPEIKPITTELKKL